MEEFMLSGPKGPESPIRRFAKDVHIALDSKYSSNKATSLGLRISGNKAVITLHISSGHPTTEEIAEYQQVAMFVKDYLQQNQPASNDYETEYEFVSDKEFIITITPKQ